MNKLSFYFYLNRQLEKYGIDILRLALAIVFIWFGALKVVGISPADDLVEKTVFFFPSNIFIPVLGAWEVAIGIGFLVKKLIPYTIFLILAHMAGTFLPLVLFPNVCFHAFPYSPSMEGQYILKNLVIIAGALAVAGKYNLAFFKRSEETRPG